jgi:hypothetical protein
MRNAYLHIFLIVLSISLLNCKSIPTDYGTQISDDEIYKFMKFVVSDLNISADVEIQLIPESLFYDTPDRKAYYKISDFCTYRVPLDSTELKSREIIIKVKAGEFRVFKASDSTFVLNQNKRILNGFKWKPKKFGYSKNRNPKKQWFSLPYFSKDRNRVVVFEEYSNSEFFMAGGSQLLSYTKTKNGWKKNIIRMTLN